MKHRVAVIPGDGIGKEVVPEAIRVLERAGEIWGFGFDWQFFDWGCEYFLKTGRMMTEDGLDRLREHDAIFLGAVGYPGVPDHVSLWGLLIPIRRSFRQYINLRPVRLFEGIAGPLRGAAPEDIDMVVQQATFTRRGVERVMRYAFELAGERRGRVSSATKSNGIIHTMPFWDEIFWEHSAEHPGVEADQYHIDALAAAFVLDPRHFDVVVASNLFGDILSDLGAAIAGSIGIAPSANLNPEGGFPSMFEPVHGSAPGIAGRDVANPIGQIWSGAMMLEHLGYAEAGKAVVRAIAQMLTETSFRTPDLGGKASTREVSQQIVEALQKHSSSRMEEA